LSETASPDQRRALLGLLFGTEVPSVLEGQMLRTSDVAALFEVSERTVSEWAKNGRIPSVRTPGGHRRYPAEGIRALLEATRRSASGSRETGGGLAGLSAIRGEASRLAPTGSC
jgi:excisionase family DNA binding protein